MGITEILIIIVNISIFLLPIIMLAENIINGQYRVLNLCMLINMFIWVYLSYKMNIKHPGFYVKCDTRILIIIASAVFIASIITFIIQMKKKRRNKILIFIATIFVFYIIMTNDTAYKERTVVDRISDKTLKEYVLEEHVPYIAFLGIEIELFVNLLSSRKTIKEMSDESNEKGNEKAKN